MDEITPATKARILIVDDLKSNIKVLAQILRSDYEISVAMNGKQALESARRDDPDLVLLDVEMPDMDGYEVCEHLKSQETTHDIPIVFVTGKDTEEDETKGLKLGAVDYITKPFRKNIVQARVKTHVALRLAYQTIEKQKLMLANVKMED